MSEGASEHANQASQGVNIGEDAICFTSGVHSIELIWMGGLALLGFGIRGTGCLDGTGIYTHGDFVTNILYIDRCLFLS